MDGSMRGALAACEDSHDIFIGIEIYSICCNLSDNSWVEAEIESSSSMLSHDLSSSMNGAVVLYLII